MNFVNIKNAPTFNRLVFAVLFLLSHVASALEIDFSKRAKDIERLKSEIRAPASDMAVQIQESVPNLSSLTYSFTEPAAEIVMIETADGFIPSSISLKQGQSYKIHIVNINADKKNLSFVLDAFSQHHAIYFNQPQKIELSPKVEGVFDFECPETGHKGQFVVVPAKPHSLPARSTASQN